MEVFATELSKNWQSNLILKKTSIVLNMAEIFVTGHCKYMCIAIGHWIHTNQINILRKNSSCLRYWWYICHWTWSLLQSNQILEKTNINLGVERTGDIFMKANYTILRCYDTNLCYYVHILIDVRSRDQGQFMFVSSEIFINIAQYVLKCKFQKCVRNSNYDTEKRLHRL